MTIKKDGQILAARLINNYGMSYQHLPKTYCYSDVYSSDNFDGLVLR